MGAMGASSFGGVLLCQRSTRRRCTSASWRPEAIIFPRGPSKCERRRLAVETSASRARHLGRDLDHCFDLGVAEGVHLALDSTTSVPFNLCMPRGGAYTVSDLPRARLCRIACKRCGRVGAYRPATLAARFGDAALPDVLIAVTACERRGDFGNPCGAHYVEPLGASVGTRGHAVAD